MKSCNLCLIFVSDHNSGTPWLICFKLWLENSGDPRDYSSLNSEILDWVDPFLKGKIAKIVIYTQVRLKGESNYEYPGQRWVFRIISDIFRIIKIYQQIWIIFWAVIIFSILNPGVQNCMLHSLHVVA